MQGALPPCMPPYPISGLPGHCAPGTIRSSCGGRQEATPGLTKLARQHRHSANPLRLHQNPDDSCVSPMTFQRRNCSTTVDTGTLLPSGEATLASRRDVAGDARQSQTWIVSRQARSRFDDRSQAEQPPTRRLLISKSLGVAAPGTLNPA
jgi:hypothetical protein